MSDLIEAANTIRQIAVKLKGFEVAAAALEKVGSFEQAEAEAKAAALKAQNEASVAMDDLKAARFEAEEARASGQRALSEAINDADTARALAKEDADRLVAEAKENAEKIIEGGKSKAAEHMRNVLSQVESEEARVAELQAQGVELNRANLEASNALEATEAKLKAARESIANLLGQ
jgi:hypothetical protein